MEYSYEAVPNKATSWSSRDFKIKYTIKKFAKNHEERLHQHVNVEALQLLDNTGLVRRLLRTKPFELVWVLFKKTNDCAVVYKLLFV